MSSRGESSATGEVKNTPENPYLNFDPILLDYEAISIPESIDQIRFVPIEHYQADEMAEARVADAIASSGIILYELVGYTERDARDIQKIANGDFKILERHKTYPKHDGSEYLRGLERAVYNKGVRIAPLDVPHKSDEYRSYKAGLLDSDRRIRLGGTTTEEALERYKEAENILLGARLKRDQFAVEHFAETIGAVRGNRTMRKHSHPNAVSIFYGDTHLTIQNALARRFLDSGVQVLLDIMDGALRYSQHIYALFVSGKDIPEDLWYKAAIEEILLDQEAGPKLSTPERRIVRTKIHSELDEADDITLAHILFELAHVGQSRSEFEQLVEDTYKVGIASTVAEKKS